MLRVFRQSRPCSTLDPSRIPRSDFLPLSGATLSAQRHCTELDFFCIFDFRVRILSALRIGADRPLFRLGSVAEKEPSRALGLRLRTKASVGRPAFFSFVLLSPLQQLTPQSSLMVFARLHVCRQSAQAKALGAISFKILFVDRRAARSGSAARGSLSAQRVGDWALSPGEESAAGSASFRRERTTPELHCCFLTAPLARRRTVCLTSQRRTSRSAFSDIESL